MRVERHVPSSFTIVIMLSSFHSLIPSKYYNSVRGIEDLASIINQKEISSHTHTKIFEKLEHTMLNLYVNSYPGS